MARRYGGRSFQLVYKYANGVHAPVEEHVDDFSDALGQPRERARRILGYPLPAEGLAPDEVDAMLDRLRAEVVGLNSEQLRAVELVASAGVEAVKMTAA